MSTSTETSLKRPAGGENVEPVAKRMKPELQETIKTQIEYYLSDENLKHDKFFHDKISAVEGGWLPLADILMCNKVKRMQVGPEEIVEVGRTHQL